MRLIGQHADVPDHLTDTIRRTWPGERVYIAPLSSRQDPARKQQIRQAAAQLPTRVVAERFGVSDRYVRRVIKRR